MTENSIEDQPNLFEAKTEDADLEKTLLCGLGEFQTRGFSLIDRRLPLDRLRGAFKRAAEGFGLVEFTDEEIAAGLARLGAVIQKVPTYVAKHPFRVTVGPDLAIRARQTYRKITGEEIEDV